MPNRLIGLQFANGGGIGERQAVGTIKAHARKSCPKPTLDALPKSIIQTPLRPVAS